MTATFMLLFACGGGIHVQTAAGLTGAPRSAGALGVLGELGVVAGLGVAGGLAGVSAGGLGWAVGREGPRAGERGPGARPGLGGQWVGWPGTGTCGAPSTGQPEAHSRGRTWTQASASDQAS